ncbi:MAG: hypothetical protein ABSG67_19120 [Thermoguttaceae bacterium]|jgi:hypothetical protein
MVSATDKNRVIDSRHPAWSDCADDWEKWRLTYEGGRAFKNRYLEKFSTREDDGDFRTRQALTPVPGFAKSAINDIRNAIFQRLRDIVRTGGSQNYQRAIAGLDGGVDRRGATMNVFLGVKVLTDLLVMGKVGVFVDNPVLQGPRISDALGTRPYLYPYQIEDILSFSCTKAEEPSEFQAILLRDTSMEYDGQTMLPTTVFQRYRRLWINETGKVSIQFYNEDGLEIDRSGNPGGPVELDLTRIPFVLLDIGDSLIKDVCQHQIALLNLVSSDVNYAIRANFPFYTEQKDGRAVGSHLKQIATDDGTATAGGQAAENVNVKVGVVQGRYYDIKAERPAFINPSPDPLRASMELQEKLEADIRKLVNLAVMTLATRASAESKQADNQGLEAGLSYIGLVLESAERQIAEFWAAYEQRNPQQRAIPTIKYPDRYSLKTDADRIDESTKLSKLMNSVPGQTVKREIAKCMVQSLLGGKVAVDTIETVNREIDAAPYTTSDPDTIIQASQAGLVGEQTASLALGFGEKEYLQARADHAARAARIAQAQGIAPAGSDPAARGVYDLSADPANAGSQEKALSRDTTFQDTTAPPVRGESAHK